MKLSQLKTLVKNVIKEWQSSIAEEKVPGTVYLDDLGIKYSPDELKMMRMAINTFSKGGHPMPDDKTVGFFGRDFVLQCLNKGEKLLARNPKYAKDLAVVKALIPKISKNPIKKEDSSDFKDGITNNMKAVNLEGVRNLSVPEKHQLRIALQTLKMADAGANVMGGMNKEEARSFLKSKGYSDQAIQKLKGNIKENDENDEESFNFKNGDKVKLTPQYAGNNKEIFTLSQWDGKRGWIGDKDGRGWFVRNFQIVPARLQSKSELDEMSSTGGVAGYSTPFAFTKNKNGSKRATDITKKMGYKVVGDSPRV